MTEHENNITNLFALIKTDEQLTQAALRIFEEFENASSNSDIDGNTFSQQHRQFNRNAPASISNNNSRRPSEVSQHQQHQSPSIRLDHHLQIQQQQQQQQHVEQQAADNNNNRHHQHYCEYDDHHHYPHQQHISFEELERRKAEKWLSTVEEHNRDFTFSPAICQKSLDLITARKQQKQRGNSSSVTATQQRRSTSAGVSRKNNHQLKHYFNSEQSQSSRTNSPKQRVDSSTAVIQPNNNSSIVRKDDGSFVDDDDENVVNRLYYADAHKRRQMEEERSIIAEANRLLRQRELILRPTLTIAGSTSTRATTPKRSGTTTPRNTTNNNNVSQQQQQNGSVHLLTSPNARDPFERGQQQQPATSSSARGISACERLYAQSQQRPLSSSATTNKKPTSSSSQDPALFERLYSEAAKIREARQQRIDAATHIKMVQLDPYEVDSMLERVHDTALEERSQEMKVLKKQFAPTFHPAIEAASARMVTARNSAAGTVFHRLATKPPHNNEH